jgi:hypothetical protein
MTGDLTSLRAEIAELLRQNRPIEVSSQDQNLYPRSYWYRQGRLDALRDVFEILVDQIAAVLGTLAIAVVITAAVLPGRQTPQPPTWKRIGYRFLKGGELFMCPVPWWAAWEGITWAIWSWVGGCRY